ncbi:MAG: hypothetical protein ACPG77_05795, partial [Nannocystaceae bacterium]
TTDDDWRRLATTGDDWRRLATTGTLGEAFELRAPGFAVKTRVLMLRPGHHRPPQSAPDAT